ncbi:hypothetical protein [Peribacillus frigoritolerans]|uniref:hypothetical protein n=1 Tax=Peribacillus frigoritolerans TaxID=450367 RepID=UPI00222EF6DD|nr:hypothetical protein [Peribacillus frigoritolerans]MDM5304185.1 hypothetical protein [Peribacillus frigoritolerans]MDM5311364.1 hypothetical protein [Peribacillus frigoritolerans]UZD47175.1 hypothetical protein OMJ04_01030 [Peribacillus frigoritolerans]WHX62244.1 hypothetical protein QNH33_01035 [Peribacillus frigoritolerans]
MKKILRMTLIIMIFIGVVACNKDVVKEKEEPVKEENVVKVEDAEKLFKGYCTELYTIKDPSHPPTFDEIADNIKGYVSEDRFKAQIADRRYQIPELVAKELNKSIEVLAVNLEEQSVNDNGTIDYTYKTVFKVYDENSSETYEKEGELTISIINNELKITREWSRGVKIDGLKGYL